MRFCSDSDIFKWEPSLYASAPSARYICRGSGGKIAGTVFTASDNEFLLCGIEPGCVLRTWNSLAMIDVCCEVVSVGEGGQMTISAVRPDDVTLLWSPGSYSNLDYAIVTYLPVIEEMSYWLSRKYDLESTDSLTDQRALRQSCVFGVISAAYASVAMTDAEGEDEVLWAKSNYYRNRFEEARCNIILKQDVDGDGVEDQLITGNVIQIERK